MVECPECGNLFHLPEIVSKSFCVNCLKEMEDGARVCLHCGYDQDSGRVIQTEYLVDDRPMLMKLLFRLNDWIPGLFRPVALLGFIICILVAAVLSLLALFVLGLGAVIGGVIIGSAAMIVWAQGIAFMLTGSIQMLKSAMVDLEGEHFLLFWFLTLLPALTVLFFMALIAKFA